MWTSTPASLQRCNRREHVIPKPNPSSWAGLPSRSRYACSRRASDDGSGLGPAIVERLVQATVAANLAQHRSRYRSTGCAEVRHDLLAAVNADFSDEEAE